MKFDKALSIQFVLFLIVLYLTNFLIVSVFQWNEKFEVTTYTLKDMLTFFSIASILLFLIHVFFKNRNKDLLGYVFLVSITVKVIISYIFILPVLNATVVNSFEKTYFFCLFLVYLFLDVYFTVRLLNKNT